MLEKLLLGRDEKYRHTILKSVARAHEMSFSDYVLKATENLVENTSPLLDTVSSMSATGMQQDNAVEELCANINKKSLIKE